MFKALLFFILSAQPVYQGDIFPVEVRLTSAEAPVNVIQADIKFPVDLLEIVSIERINSILELWPQEPSFSNEFGLASLIGGLPTPAFQEKNGLIGRINFRAKKIGAASLVFQESSKAFLNDGAGEGAVLELKNSTIQILSAPEGGDPRSITLAEDLTPPAAFAPVIGREKSVFSGKYFVAFNTQDNESGLSHYEVQEIKDGEIFEWQKAISPYVLENQKGKVVVRVKAVDRAGNETISETAIIIQPPYFLYGAAAIIGASLIWLVRRRLRLLAKM